MSIKIYHNPRCSKSRQTLELIRQHGIEPEIVLYLQQPPTVAELSTLVDQLGISPEKLLRFKEDKAEELGIRANDKRSKAEWIALLTANPELIERPIVVCKNQAVVCRPPEKVLALL